MANARRRKPRRQCAQTPLRRTANWRSRGDVRAYQATAYLGYAPGNWFANAALVYGADDYTSSRQVIFPGINETARADYSGHQYTAFGTTGYHYRIGDGRTVITPLASLQYTRLNTDVYTETGGNSVNLRVNARSDDLVQSGLGVKLARNMATTGTRIVRPELHINWLHSFNAEGASSTAAFACGGPQFTTSGVRTGRNILDLGASVLVADANAWSFEAGYDYQHSQGFSAGQVMLKATLSL